MRSHAPGRALTRAAAPVLLGLSLFAAPAPPSHDEIGVRGGRLSIAQRAEPKTLNPTLALDQPSKDLTALLMADLVHINRETQQTEPALAESWRVSADGRRYTIQLRRGLRFSDGHPLDADDVVFSYGVYLDEKLGSPQRDLLVIDGQPLKVTKRNQITVDFDLPQAYAAAERLFDSVAILPRHILEKPYQEGRLAHVWTLATPPPEIVGAGPFRMKQYTAGARVVVERNPYYWAVDAANQPLPYLDEVAFSIMPNEDAQVLRFQAGEADVLSRIGAENFTALNARRDPSYHLIDAGPSLEYNFLFFNLNDVPTDSDPAFARRRTWFSDERFRRAVSLAVDREAIVRLVYQGRATPAWSHVTAGNKRWLNAAIPKEPRSIARARQALKAAGFDWVTDGTLVDSQHQPVTFSIIVAASNTARSKMATLLQADLADIGMRVQVVPLEFRTMLTRVLDSKDYDAAIFGLAGGDADPNVELNVWLSSGVTHVWHPAQRQPSTAWETEIDRIMRQQLTATDYAERKRLYDRVQILVAEHLPIICLASPNVLVGASARLGNFRPAVIEPLTLWNVAHLFWRPIAPKRNSS